MAQQEQKSSSHDFDKIWKLMMENREQMKETDRQLKASMTETDRRMQETDRQLKASMAETDRQLKANMAETDRQMKETDRRLKKLDYLFTGHWGKLMEALTKGGLVQALKKRNIPVTGLLPNAEKTYKDQRREFDIVAINGEMVVVVEVKTTLKVQHIQSFLETMKNIKNYFPEYADKKIYGAMAYLKSNEGAGSYAEKQGLFILNPVGNIVKVMNSAHFSPKPMA